MAPLLSAKRRSMRVLQALCFCMLAVSLSLCSCNKSQTEDPDRFRRRLDERRRRLNENIEREGIQRIPPKSFEFPPLVDSSELRSTLVARDLSAELPPGRNVVYCATYKLADAFLNDGMTMQEAAATSLVDELPAGSYRLSKGTPEEVRAELATDFPSAAEPLGLLSDEPWLWCCYFQRSLPFLEAFKRLEEPLSFQSSVGEFAVASFGFRFFVESSTQQALRKMQVSVIDFKDEDDFIIRLNTEVKDDELILAKVQPEESLHSTLVGVMRRVENNQLEGTELSQIRDGEALVVPIITINLMDRFSERPLGLQTIRFRLDEKGATLDAFLGYNCLPGEDVLRQMVFDKPFLLYLKSKTADVPYFVLWVENLEVLEAFVPEPEAEQALTKEQS